MTTIYLPVEVIKRELTSRAMQASKLAASGNICYVFEHTFFDRNGWPDSGIYIGKNCFRTERPYPYTYYKAMKDAGISLWYLDEEGGPYTGESEEGWCKELRLRMDPAGLQADDKILAWGLWQQQWHLENGAQCEVHATGSPNFDIYQKKYHTFFSERDLEKTGGMNNFILINTRFSIANPLNSSSSLQELMKAGSPVSTLIPSDFIENIFLNESYLFLQFIELVRELAKQLPDEQIVLRPHPAESDQIYKAMTKNLSNVHVIGQGSAESWIRQSRLLIHNGCTTATQAHIAGKPVISYCPEPKASGSITTLGFQNKMGKKCSTVDDVIASIKNGCMAANADATAEISRSIARLDTVDYIVNMVNEHNRQHHGESKGNHLIGTSHKTYKLQSLKDVARRAASFLSISPREMFDYDAFSEISDLVGIWNKGFGFNVKIEKVAEGCYVFY